MKGSRKGTDKAGLQATVKNMKLKDGGLDDVYVRDEEINNKLVKAARLLLVARVNTRHPFSIDAFKDMIKFAWRLACELEIH